jgi:hypothetical protein
MEMCIGSDIYLGIVIGIKCHIQIQIQKLYLTSSFTIKNTSIAAIARHGEHVGMRCVMD